jgi:hypothetical protein
MITAPDPTNYGYICIISKVNHYIINHVNTSYKWDVTILPQDSVSSVIIHYCLDNNIVNTCMHQFALCLIERLY